MVTLKTEKAMSRATISLSLNSRVMPSERRERPGGRGSRHRDLFQQAAEALHWLRDAERPQRCPDRRLIGADHRLADPFLDRGHRLDGSPRGARAEQRAGFRPTRPRGELDHGLRVLIVDALVARGGGA